MSFHPRHWIRWGESARRPRPRSLRRSNWRASGSSELGVSGSALGVGRRNRLRFAPKTDAATPTPSRIAASIARFARAWVAMASRRREEPGNDLRPGYCHNAATCHWFRNFRVDGRSLEMILSLLAGAFLVFGEVPEGLLALRKFLMSFGDLASIARRVNSADLILRREP